VKSKAPVAPKRIFTYEVHVATGFQKHLVRRVKAHDVATTSTALILMWDDQPIVVVPIDYLLMCVGRELASDKSPRKLQIAELPQ